MKKTKIICTMGPRTMDKIILKELIAGGMNVARFNFSHGSYEEHAERIALVRQVSEQLGIPVALMLDTKGPEIRTGLLKDGKKVSLEQGKEFTLYTEEREGDETGCSITYQQLVYDVRKGDTILIDDGLIGLEVQRVSADFSTYTLLTLLISSSMLCIGWLVTCLLLYHLTDFLTSRILVLVF